MVNFGLLAAEIVSLVWGTPANLNGFRVLAALLHRTLVAKLRRSTEGATYIRQGGHQVGHWPTFLVLIAQDDFMTGTMASVSICYCVVSFFVDLLCL